MLTSGLLVIEHTIIQLLVALGVSVAFMVAFREWKPFYEIETDVLSYICGMFPGVFMLFIYPVLVLLLSTHPANQPTYPF